MSGHRAPDLSASRIGTALDLAAPGKRAGHFRLTWSDNENPLGHRPVPLGVIAGAPGPTVLLTAGVHGDEYEGPVALIRLFQTLAPEAVRGRLILLPALNAPAVADAARVSPLDGANLNRAFPGDPDGGPTAMLAHLLEACLMPVADAVIDLHSGGKASWFVPCALAARAPDGGLDAANVALAAAFAPLIWVLGAQNDDRSVNGAATRAGLPCIAAELGGGGALGIDPLALAEAGLRAALSHLGVLDAPVPEHRSRAVEIAHPAQSVCAMAPGFWVPAVAAGADVVEGALLGQLLDPLQIDAAARAVYAPCDGLLLAETRRGLVAPGDFLGLVASDVPEDYLR
ncbi:MAG: succinylglutamate desuccinylase/aspartoacylase family protein [Pseudomonadota bacterium]